jgi:hypothetical protein
MVVLLLTAQMAMAQVPGTPFGRYQPLPRPALSPYLNLLRSGNIGYNYYTLVQPQMAFQKGINQLQQDIVATNQQIQSDIGGDPSQLTTGHKFGYMTHTKYFLNQGLGGAGTTGGGFRPGAATPLQGTGRGVPSTPISPMARKQ